MNPIFYVDFYKVGHIDQWAPGIDQVWVNWTPRTTRIPNQEYVVHFGLQYFIKKILIEQFDKKFFSKSLKKILAKYTEFISKTLAVEHPRTDHIEALHNLGYLPIKIFAVREGTKVPIGMPCMVMTNTHPDFFWLPSYLETMLSMHLWKSTTSATTADRYKRLFTYWAKEAGEQDLSYIDYQGHDFSMRGMSGLDDAILSGLGHLTSFKGTDTAPVILAAHKYYGADFSPSSVFATEHGTMCSGTEEGEFETYRRLLQDVYPTGIVSIVSDTWNLWRVCTDYIPRLKDLILARDGKLILRPDSGDPVEIICGKPDRDFPVTPEKEGVLRLLARALGTVPNPTGKLPLINKGGAVYGDAITYDRANQMLARIVDELRLSPTNMTFGIGSFTYEYVTRDTHGFAVKATAIKQNGEVIPIFKRPVTDHGGKFSHKGIPVLYLNEDNSYTCKETNDPTELENSAYDLIFETSMLRVDESFDTIRQRIAGEKVCLTIS